MILLSKNDVLGARESVDNERSTPWASGGNITTSWSNVGGKFCNSRNAGLTMWNTKRLLFIIVITYCPSSFPGFRVILTNGTNSPLLSCPETLLSRVENRSRWIHAEGLPGSRSDLCRGSEHLQISLTSEHNKLTSVPTFQWIVYSMEGHPSSMANIIKRNCLWFPKSGVYQNCNIIDCLQVIREVIFLKMSSE